MENNEIQTKETWQAPELKVLGVSEQTLAGSPGRIDGVYFS
jgi:hypothetical protein